LPSGLPNSVNTTTFQPPNGRGFTTAGTLYNTLNVYYANPNLMQLISDSGVPATNIFPSTLAAGQKYSLRFTYTTVSTLNG